MLRGVVYLVSGWLLLAFVGGMAEVLGLTVMLPATSAILLTHAAFGPISVPSGLAVAVALGYLEDLHQGAPIGCLTLSHALAFLGVRWAAQRFHIGNTLMQAAAGAAGILLVDAISGGILFTLSDAFGIRREALLASFVQVRWHVLGTALAAPVLWLGLDLLLQRLRLDVPPPASTTTFSQGFRRGRSQ